MTRSERFPFRYQFIASRTGLIHLELYGDVYNVEYRRNDDKIDIMPINNILTVNIGDLIEMTVHSSGFNLFDPDQSFIEFIYDEVESKDNTIDSTKLPEYTNSLTKREQFAISVLQGLLAGRPDSVFGYEEIAVKIADELIKELEK